LADNHVESKVATNEFFLTNTGVTNMRTDRILTIFSILTVLLITLASCSSFPQISAHSWSVESDAQFVPSRIIGDEDFTDRYIAFRVDYVANNNSSEIDLQDIRAMEIWHCNAPHTMRILYSPIYTENQHNYLLAEVPYEFVFPESGRASARICLREVQAGILYRRYSEPVRFDVVAE
jgi:hypothetical protein